MKTFKIIIAAFGMLVGTFALLSLKAPQQTGTHIGDIKYSILSPDLFNETQQGRWVLVDGKPLSQESELYTFLEGKMRLDILDKKNDTYILPDARGRFVRSMNVNGQGDDPDANRKVGSFQNDMLQTHTHAMGAGVSDKKADSQINRARFADFAQASQHGPFQTKGVINARTGNETRPKNITFYTYIKIEN